MPTVDLAKTIVARADPPTELGPASDDPITILVNTLVKSFKPLYTTLIVTCILSAMLVPLLVVLMFFSNHELRRKPVFIGNVFAIAIGITFAGVTLGLTVTILLNPLMLIQRSIPLGITFVGLLAFGPILVESVLLIRLWAVYPIKVTPRITFLAIFIPIMLLKIGRITNVIIYLVDLTQRANDDDHLFLLFEQTWTTFPNYRIEWFLQVADNTITSALFLAKLNKGRTLRSVTGGRLASTIDSLFWIAVYNFVIPVILSIAELIVIWTHTDIFQVVPICIVNLYVEIIGVLLATVWAAGTTWQDTQRSTGSGVQVLTTIADADMSGVDSMSAVAARKKSNPSLQRI